MVMCYLLLAFYLSNTGLTESLFLTNKDEYPEHEQASLKQLYHAKVIFIIILL